MLRNFNVSRSMRLIGLCLLIATVSLFGLIANQVDSRVNGRHIPEDVLKRLAALKRVELERAVGAAATAAAEPMTGGTLVPEKRGRAFEVGSDRFIEVDTFQVGTQCKLVFRIRRRAIGIEQIVAFRVNGRTARPELAPGTNDAMVECSTDGGGVEMTRRDLKGIEGRFILRQ